MTNLIKAEYVRFFKSKIPFVLIIIMIGSVLFSFFNMQSELKTSRFFNSDEVFLKYKDNVFELPIEERVVAANELLEAYDKAMGMGAYFEEKYDANTCDDYLEGIISYSRYYDNSNILADFSSSLGTFSYSFLIVCAFFGASRYSSGSIRREIVSGKSKWEIFFATLFFNLSLLIIFMIIKTIVLSIMLACFSVFLGFNEAVVLSFLSVLGMNCVAVIIETIIELLISEVAIQAVVNVVVLIFMAFVSNAIYPFPYYFDNSFDDVIVEEVVSYEDIYDDVVVHVEVFDKDFEETTVYAELSYVKINELTRGKFFERFDLSYVEQTDDEMDWNLFIHNINPLSKTAPFSWYLVNNSNKTCLKRIKTDIICSFSEVIILSLAGALIYSRKEFS